MQDATVLLAEIDRPRGLKGEVVATLHADDPERLDSIGNVWIVRPGESPGEGGAGVRARLEGWKRKAHRVVLKLSGIDSVDQAKAVQGCEIRIEAAESLQEAPDGRWFAHQLEGLEVVVPGGRSIGRVSRVLNPAGQALLEVKGDEGEWLVPLVPAICVNIDPEAGKIEIDPPEGLLELNAV